MIQLIGKENVNLSEKQIEEVIDLIDKEEILEVEDKIEKALSKDKIEEIKNIKVKVTKAKQERQIQCCGTASPTTTPPCQTQVSETPLKLPPNVHEAKDKPKDKEL